MFTSSAGSWDRVRQAFADQFEQDGANIVYRRSQEGEAIRVSAEERSKFVDEFDRNLGRAKWIIYIGLTVALGGVILLSVLRGSDLSEAAVFAGIGLVMIPYFGFYRWAWAAPARELSGRTPMAGERSPEEVRRLRFQRITYSQLAGAAFAGLMIPFIGSSRNDVFSGWNRLWLVLGGALVLLVAVQAFRKWRSEQEDSFRSVIPRPANPDITKVVQDPTPAVKKQFWRYLPLAGILLGFAIVAYTPAGKQLAKQPTFWPILMIGFGCWALFTVARGLSKGEIEPFARGFYNTYQRETQPKRFWGSIGWNSIFGCFCLWLAFQMNGQTEGQPVQDRCSNRSRAYSPREALAACNQLMNRKGSFGGLSRTELLLDRGIAYDDLQQPLAAIADYSAALRLQPDFFEAYFDRGLAYEQVGDVAHAVSDFGNAIRLRPRDADAYFRRGLAYLLMRRFDEAIGDFTQSHNLNPKDPWPIANRGLAYAWKEDRAHAEQDFAAVRTTDSSNYVLLHGEALLSMQSGDMPTAADRLSAALAHNANDTWSLRMRAYVYQQLGDFEKAQADRNKLLQLSKSTKAS